MIPTPSPDLPLRLLLHGAGGRMGRAALALLPELPQLRLVAAVSRSDHPRPDGVPAFAVDALEDVPAFDVAVDFSLAPAFPRLLTLCVARRAALVSGTTGLTAADRDALAAAGAQIPLLWASNFSIGAAVLGLLAERAAALLAEWDCEIVETHHRHKLDAPSGTALALGEAVARGREAEFTWTDRIGQTGARVAGSLGIASLRGGDVVGDHRLSLFGSGERIELAHQATDRSVFARGALLAASRIAGKPPGRYRLLDLIRG